MHYTAHVMNQLVFVLLAVTAVATAKIEFPPEWHAWKSEHQVTYATEIEELQKHVVWLSNKQFIDEHNKYEDVFGYNLKMNRYGDLVSRKNAIVIVHHMQYTIFPRSYCHTISKFGCGISMSLSHSQWKKVLGLCIMQ